MKLIERGKLTPEAYKRLSGEQDELHKAAFEVASERAAEVKAEPRSEVDFSEGGA